MSKRETRAGYLKKKRNEIIFALLEADQGYNNADIATIFNMNRSTVMRIAAKKPKSYKVKWRKIE